MLLDRLLGNLDLTLTAFAVCEVARGWRLRLGGLDWVTVHFVLSGSGRLRMTDRRVLALPPGSLALVPSSRAHLIETGDPVEHEASATQPRHRGDDLDVYRAGPHEDEELVVVCGRLQASYRGEVGLFDGLSEPLVLEFAESPQMTSVFERLLAEERSRSAASGPMMTALMNEALILLFRQLCADPECPLPWLTALEDERLSQPLDSMLEHPEQHHSVESLAAIAHMSRSAFARRFAHCFHRPPMDYLHDLRLRRAAQLLGRDDLSIEEVASKVGFASRSHFSHTFREHFGSSPLAFREERSNP